MQRKHPERGYGPHQRRRDQHHHANAQRVPEHLAVGFHHAKPPVIDAPVLVGSLHFVQSGVQFAAQGEIPGGHGDAETSGEYWRTAGLEILQTILPDD